MMTNKIYLSLIITTNRGIDSLKPLFKTTDKNTELIIVDKNYNEKTKEFLKTQKDKYEKIIYSPIKESPTKYQRDFAQGLNTSLLLSENGWIVRADDNLEFKDDFFDAIRKNIESFGDIVGNDRFAIIGQKLWGALEHKKWNDYYSTENPSRYIEVNNPNFTFSFGFYPIDLIYTLNGYDERYDVGFGFEDVQFLHRALIAGYKIFYDRQLMAYSLSHTPKRDAISVTDMLYKFDTPEINSGKVHAFNSFNLRQFHPGFLSKRESYILD